MTRERRHNSDDVPSEDNRRPRTRQRVHRPPAPLSVPNIDDDAAERKRVLNVLAQRRYRERKRQSRQKPRQPMPPPTAECTLTAVAISAPASDSLLLSPGTLAFACDDLELLSWGMEDGQMDADTMEGAEGDALAALLMDSVAVDPLLISGSSSTGDTVGNTTASPRSDSLSPDSYLLPVPELTLLRAAMRIATRLGCPADVWRLEAQSPFYVGGQSEAAAHLPNPAIPPNWQPTAAQRAVAHHPVLDVLPWPTARERLIGIFSLPAAARPAVAADPLALVYFVYDLEDAAEGLRIWGADPYDVSSWEVGQRVFERWWFAFDQGIVEQSNRWRRLRGAEQLRMG